MPSTYSRITSCSSLTSSRPAVDAAGQAAELLLCEPPFFSSRFRWIDSLDLIQGLGHPQAGRVQRPSLIVIEDPTHRRAVVEHHGAGRIGPAVQAESRRLGGHRDGGFGIISGGGLLASRPSAA